MIRFIDRKGEIERLDKDWNDLENGFIVIYGRRRIGKTRLLDEFVKDKKGTKYTAEDTHNRIQISEFKNALADHLNDRFLREQDIKEWSHLFSYLQKTLSKNKKEYIWIDEFSYLIKNGPEITSVLQKFIDNFIRKSKTFLIVSGSLFGIIKEKVLESSSPLYGRRSRDLLLGPLSFKYAKKFLKMSFLDKLKTYLFLGGIPEYLLAASRYKSHKKFIQEEYLKKDGYFYREPLFLLSTEFKEIRTYFSIINAIAYGKTKPTEIAGFVGINNKELYPYLELLINHGLIKRTTPKTVTKKRGIYKIKDNFFDSWFNIIYRNREDIERGHASLSKQELNQFIGKRFEVFIRRNIPTFLESFTDVGHWWHKDKEIDILALNRKKNSALFVECKWKDRVNAEKIIGELKEKAQHVRWRKEKRKEIYAVFAKSFSKKLKKINGSKVHCFDLKDIEKLF